MLQTVDKRMATACDLVTDLKDDRLRDQLAHDRRRSSEVEAAPRHGVTHGAASSSSHASQGLSPQGFSQRRSAHGSAAPLPLEIERHSVETPTLCRNSLPLCRSPLPQVDAYSEMQRSASRDTSLLPNHQGIAPYGTLQAAASRTGTGFTQTPGSALQAYDSIENATRESNVLHLQATDSPARRGRRSAAASPHRSSSRGRRSAAASPLYSPHRSSSHASATSRRGGRFVVEEVAGVGGGEGAELSTGLHLQAPNPVPSRRTGIPLMSHLIPFPRIPSGSVYEEGLESSKPFPDCEVHTGTDFSTRKADTFAITPGRDSSLHSTNGTRRRRLKKLLQEVALGSPCCSVNSEHSHLRDNSKGGMTPSWSRKVAGQRYLDDDNSYDSRSEHSRLSQRPTTIAQFFLEHDQRQALGRVRMFAGELSRDVEDLIDQMMAGKCSSHDPGDKIGRRTENKGVVFVPKFLKYFTGTMAPLNSWLGQGIARHEVINDSSNGPQTAGWCSAARCQLVCMYCMDAINVLLRGAAQVVLLNSPLTGAFIVVALYIQVCVCVCVCVCVYNTYIYIHAYIHTHIQSVPIATYICICIHTHMYVSTHTHTHAHTHTHTHTHSL